MLVSARYLTQALKLFGAQAHKLLTRDEEQVLSKYIVEMRPYESELDAMMAGGRDQPSDEARLCLAVCKLWSHPTRPGIETACPTLQPSVCHSSLGLTMQVSVLHGNGPWPRGISMTDQCPGHAVSTSWSMFVILGRSPSAAHEPTASASHPECIDLGPCLISNPTRVHPLRAHMHPVLTHTGYAQVWADACGFQGHHEAFLTKVRRCRQAKEIFEYCNLRMVAKIAHRYVSQGVEMEVSLPKSLMQASLGLACLHQDLAPLLAMLHTCSLELLQMRLHPCQDSWSP